ncbi:MAG: hypothetical protein B6D65_01130 [candidate division Zixibacteria bacterium 4484_93]|nr:MAG: hypothetical protein B6D65_01130 [candidate division Zixibacteria bacterium 4484_93]
MRGTKLFVVLIALIACLAGDSYGKSARSYFRDAKKNFKKATTKENFDAVNEAFSDLKEAVKISGNKEKAYKIFFWFYKHREGAERLEKKDEFNSLIEFGENMLSSLPDEGVLITFERYETYPLLFLQAVEGEKCNLTIISKHLLNQPTYVEANSDKLGIKLDAENMEKLIRANIEPAQVIIDSLASAASSGGKRLFFPISIPPNYFKRYMNNLTFLGLVWEYNGKPPEKYISIIKKRVVEDYSYDAFEKAKGSERMLLRSAYNNYVLMVNISSTLARTKGDTETALSILLWGKEKLENHWMINGALYKLYKETGETEKAEEAKKNIQKFVEEHPEEPRAKEFLKILK